MARVLRSRKPKSSASGSGESSTKMVASSTTPFEWIDITCRTPNVLAYDVFKKFEQIGEIRDLKKNNNVTFTVWFVKEVEEPVSEKCSREKGKMNDTIPDQQSPRHIINALNDDCLMEIFERLDLPDLYTVAWVCKRFRSSAVKVFKANKDDHFNLDDLMHRGRGDSNAPLSHFITGLRIFSPTLVDIPECYDINIILQAMAEHCTELEELDFDFDKVKRPDPQTLPALRSLLSKVRKLRIRTTNILDDCVDFDWQLEELYIESNKDPVLPNIKTPKLTKLSISYCEEVDSPDSTRFSSLVFDFLAKNGGQLTELKFGSCNFSWARWCSLAECAPNVEKLSLHDCDVFDKDDQVPGIFRHLKTSKLDDSHDWDSFMKLLVGASLDHLRIVDDLEVDVIPIDTICQLTTITKLSIDLFKTRISRTDLLQLTRSLSGLQELDIRVWAFTLANIRRILNESKTIVKLSIRVRGNTKLSIEPAILDDISAIIAARPEFQQIIISAYRERLKSPLQNWHPYSSWLKVKIKSIDDLDDTDDEDDD